MSEARAALESVYARLVALRRPGAEKPPPATFRAIAAELPGALRILDRMPEGELGARLAALASGQDAPWIDATLAWRDVMRTALAVRRAGGRERSIAWARAREPVPLGEVVAILRPSGGRLVPWALEKVGDRVGRAPSDVEALIFGSLAAAPDRRRALVVDPPKRAC